jgi:hypothetical protein
MDRAPADGAPALDAASAADSALDAASADSASDAPPAADSGSPPGQVTHWEETLAPGMALVGNARQTSAFEVAGGMSTSSAQGFDSAAWMPGRFTPIKAANPDKDNPGWYRRNVYQGVPPQGAAFSPTLADYGDGKRPTYVRVELRRGARQVLKGPIDAWKADKATYSAFGYTGLKRVVRELMEYDERVGDALQYGRSWAPSSDDTRNRVERVFEGKVSAVADNDTKPRWFEWNVYLEPGWPGQWAAQTGKTKLSILQIKRTSAFLSFYCTRGDANGAKGQATFNWADNGPVGGGVDLDPQTKTIPLSQIVGVWIQVRVEAKFAVNGWFKIYLRFGSGPLKLFFEQSPANMRDGGASTFGTTHPTYGMYATGALNIGNDGWFNPKAGRRTVVWYTGVRAGAL